MQNLARRDGATRLLALSSRCRDRCFLKQEARNSWFWRRMRAMSRTVEPIAWRLRLCSRCLGHLPSRLWFSTLGRAPGEVWLEVAQLLRDAGRATCHMMRGNDASATCLAYVRPSPVGTSYLRWSSPAFEVLAGRDPGGDDLLANGEAALCQTTACKGADQPRKRREPRRRRHLSRGQPYGDEVASNSDNRPSIPLRQSASLPPSSRAAAPERPGREPNKDPRPQDHRNPDARQIGAAFLNPYS